MKYAKVIIDISAEQVDRAFTYRIPGELSERIVPGVRVQVPFGSANKAKTGFVIGLSDEAEFDESRIKPILSLLPKALDTNADLIGLAAFMAAEYGCTMNQALKAVLPVKKAVGKNRRRKDPVAEIRNLSGAGEDAGEAKETVSPANGGGLSEGGAGPELMPDEELNREQAEVCAAILKNTHRPTLLYGITGSGKTRVYIELIRHMQALKKQTIVLIPEISLTYQTVRELTAHLGSRVAVMHSRLSQGEKYEQYMKAANGEIDVMVGPRSALFTPFAKLGLIVIDEEHERTYQSDTAPRYDTREVAARRAEMAGAYLVLGSATPSLESYSKALKGEYALGVLKNRAHPGALMPAVYVEDMRRELEMGNRSIFSERLKELTEDRLERGEQIMLFLNRRGYAGFVSCRSCGTVIKCPHCDVSLTAHNSWYVDPGTGQREAALLSCHYCGYTQPMPRECPQCASRFIAPFGTGTQKLEQAVKKMYPRARVLRMDADSTAAKGSYERILSSFQKGKADILIGTQMIVKGHDFPNVTLVGIVAADMSLNTSEYDASERTFQLITQAAGRSGRGDRAGDVVIQTYDPGHYAVELAAKADYESFYAREMSYRRLMHYPPDTFLMRVRLRSEDEALAAEAAEFAADRAVQLFQAEDAVVIGPCNEALYKINDNYRKILYIKHPSHDIIIKIRDTLEEAFRERYGNRNIYTSFDIR